MAKEGLRPAYSDHLPEAGQDLFSKNHKKLNVKTRKTRETKSVIVGDNVKRFEDSSLQTKKS